MKALSLSKASESDSPRFSGAALGVENGQALEVLDRKDLNNLSISASGGLGKIQAFTGSAMELPGRFPYPGHAGNRMPRIRFLSWDVDNRYSIAHRGSIYPHKPVGHSSNEVPMKLEQGWILVNVHSLGRLGLFSEEIVKDVKRNLLHSAVSIKLKRIDQCYQIAPPKLTPEKTLSPLNKDLNWEDKSKQRTHDLNNYHRWLRSVAETASHHPNEEVGIIVKKALDSFLKLDERRQYPSSHLVDLKRKLREAGMGALMPNLLGEPKSEREKSSS